MKWSAALVGTLIVLTLAACASKPNDAAIGCDQAVSSTSEAMAAADVVYTTRVLKRVDDQKLDGQVVHTYSVTNLGLPSLKGDDIGYEDLRVISHPGCADEPYIDGDPLADAVDGANVVLFILKTADGEWITLPQPMGVVDPSKVSP